jgi:DNA-nicking Smr family endonuclease
MKRRTTDEERALFEATVRETRPRQTAKKSATSSSPHVARTAPKTKSKAPSGLDGRTAKRLKRGALDPEAKLDLHGYTATDAHRALLLFLRSAQARGLRLALVVTGKGRKADAHEPFDLAREPRGVLKTSVPRWLAEPAFAGFVAGIAGAHRRHGGDGAFYVYLRKVRA